MAMSVFDDKNHMPTDDDLAFVLGRSKAHWDALHEYLADRYMPLTHKWGFPGAKHGWSCRLIQQKRTILVLIPDRKYFHVSFALREPALETALSSDLEDSVKQAIRDAPVYAEGRGVRIDVRTKMDAAIVKKLADIKMTSCT